MSLGDEAAEAGIPSSDVTGWGELPPVSDASSCAAGTWGDGNSTQGAGGGWEATPYGQPHRWITDSPINWNLSDEEDAADKNKSQEMEQDNVDVCGSDEFSYAEQVAPSVYAQHTKEYTAVALQQLLNSPQYQRMNTRCQMCWHIWSEMQCSMGCRECGGFAMQRPCPICAGRCGQVWHRDVEQSHSNHLAHWDGQCGLPYSEQIGYLQQVMMEKAEDEDDIIDGLEELNTG